MSKLLTSLLHRADLLIPFTPRREHYLFAYTLRWVSADQRCGYWLGDSEACCYVP